MKKSRFHYWLILVLLIPTQAFALLKDTEDFNRFQAYEFNNIVYKYTEDDDNSLQFNLSMRYIFSKDGIDEPKRSCNTYHFFSYTGSFDFYWFKTDTRPSAPVVSRYQNPAYHFRLNGKLPKDSVVNCDSGLYIVNNMTHSDWIDIGVEHISNGQSFTASDYPNLVLANTDNHAFMDSISRVAAAIGLTTEIQWSFPLLFTQKHSELSVKWYAYRVDQEADVFWGEFANEDVDFNDFQRFRIQYTITLSETDAATNKHLPTKLFTELNVGDLGMSQASWNIKLNYPIYNLPFVLGAHFGPMTNLSDYTKHENTITFGFEFTY